MAYTPNETESLESTLLRWTSCTCGIIGLNDQFGVCKERESQRTTVLDGEHKFEHNHALDALNIDFLSVVKQESQGDPTYKKLQKRVLHGKPGGIGWRTISCTSKEVGYSCLVAEA